MMVYLDKIVDLDIYDLRDLKELYLSMKVFSYTTIFKIKVDKGVK